MTADAAEIVRLAERGEQAAGPDRELDIAIALLQPEKFFNAGPKYEGGPDRIGQIVGSDRCVPGNGGPAWLVPGYTASLDAAMTLVPSGFMWRLQSWPDGVNSALLEKNAGDFGAIDARHTEAFAATPALALAAAALRARAAQHDHEVG